jgi:hypothetical protein
VPQLPSPTWATFASCFGLNFGFSWFFLYVTVHVSSLNIAGCLPSWMSSNLWEEFSIVSYNW